MDPQWNGAPPSGSITCMLCRGSVPFTKTETQNFRSHLQHHHGVFYHYDVLISVNVLSKKYLSRIVQDYEKSGDKSELVGEEDFEEVVELEEIVEKPSNNSVVLPSRKKEKVNEAKVHNCKTCNAKFERLSDLIEHVNEHKAEEKREQDEVEMKRQALENERRRLIEEKKVIKQQKDIEKRRLEGEKAKKQLELQNRRQLELKETSRIQAEAEENRKIELEKERELEDTDAKVRKDLERSREIAKMKATLKQFRESDIVGTIEEDTKVAKEHSSVPVQNEPRPLVVFECQECPYTTKRNIELKLHKLSHTGEKNFACEHCDEKFYLDRHLKRHALKHTTEFAKKFNVQNAVFDEPRQFAELDTSLPVKPYVDETMISEDHSQPNSYIVQSLPKKKHKRSKVESAQDKIMNVLSEDSNPEDPRPKSRASLGGRGISEIAVNSDYFQKFPNQIKRGSATDERFDKQDPTMPEGWKCREIGRPNGRVDKEYCSPDFMVFRSKKAKIEYMKMMERYSQEEIERGEKGN